MFHNAQNLAVTGGGFYSVSGDLVLRQDVGSKGIDLLREHIAPGALHNSDERYDPPKCHPLTRQAVLDKLIAWITEMDQEEFRTFWLYGSAGVGKSAILQTIAELCHARGLLLASFFFSRTSATRNNRSRLIPTLCYQIALSSPLLKEHINRVVAEDPTIFKRSLDVQLQSLVVEPLLESHRRQDSNNRPLIVLDGLDECSNTDDQCHILRELVEAFHSYPLRIRLLIASRPEQRILAAFNRGVLQNCSQRLSLDNPSLLSEAYADIEVFLRHKFMEIKTSHPLCAYIPPEWPPNCDVRIILEKASHHFIFVSTVIRFVGCPRHLPVARLRAICNTSLQTEERPFAELDTLYLTILACVENIQPVIEILGMLIVPDRSWSTDSLFSSRTNSNQSIDFISRFLGWTPEELRFHLMDLSSLVDLDVPDSSSLRIFHASFSDFLMDERRSKEYYIDSGIVHAHLAKLCFQQCGLRCQGDVADDRNRSRSTLIRRGKSYHLSNGVAYLNKSSEQWSYVDDNLVHHFKNAVPTRELRQQLAHFDATSALTTCHSFPNAVNWGVFSSIIEQIRISAFPEVEGIFPRQLRNLDHYLRLKLPVYHSDARLRDLVTFMMCHLMEYSEGNGDAPSELDLFSWAAGVLDLTPDLYTKNAQTLNLFSLPILPPEDFVTSHLTAFLGDTGRAGTFFVDGQRYASLALRFARRLCKPSVEPIWLIKYPERHRMGLRLFGFFLSRSSHSSELKGYLTSHTLVFRKSIEFVEALRAISVYVKATPPTQTSNP